MPHWVRHHVAFTAVSRAPLAKRHTYKRRMGWTFTWASSFGSDFNYDFHVGITKEEWETGTAEYNFGPTEVGPWEPGEAIAAGCGTDWATYRQEGPGMSAFVLKEGMVYLTYSTHSRGLDGLRGMYQWLDRAPLGRNEMAGGGSATTSTSRVAISGASQL